MGTEQDDWDILRSEGEGFGMVNYDMLSGDEIEAQELYVFLQKIVDSFKTNNALLGIEEASIGVLSGMGIRDKALLMGIVKKHLISSVCHAHLKDIINDENYSENVGEGEPAEGSIIDYKLTEANIGRFLVLEGSGGLRAHIKEMVGPGKWKELEDLEMDRIYNDARWHKGAASG